MQIIKKLSGSCIFCGSKLKLKNEYDDETLIGVNCGHEYILKGKIGQVDEEENYT